MCLQKVFQVVASRDITFVFMCALQKINQLDDNISPSDERLIREIHDHISKHGDAVKDVAYHAENVGALYDAAVARGATGVQKPLLLKDERDGDVEIATIKTFGDVCHSLVDRSRYSGAFLPGYHRRTDKDPINDYLSGIDVLNIDHCVGNQDWNQLGGVES